MAREAGLDLVEVAPTARPPVCRIMDYGKWRYQQQKKDDKSRANSKGGRLKQLNIDTVRIGEHDLLIKINHARDFLKEGNKVQFTLRFKGREMAHLDLGRNLLNKVKQELFLVSKVDARQDGRAANDSRPPARPQEPGDRQAADRHRLGFATGRRDELGSGLNIPPRTAPAAGPAAPRPPLHRGPRVPAVAPPRPRRSPSALTILPDSRKRSDRRSTCPSNPRNRWTFGPTATRTSSGALQPSQSFPFLLLRVFAPSW